MRSLVAAVLAFSLPAIALAQDDSTKPISLDSTIRKGLDFLVKDALAWKKEHNCVSCHHASMMVWAMNDAKQHGFAVDEPVLHELTKWVAESGDGKTGVPRPPGIPKALNTKAVWFALALATDPKPDAESQKEMNVLRKTVQHDQLENGAWAAWPETRPPFFGDSDEYMTVLATLALMSGAHPGDDESTHARDNGVKWLADHKTGEDPLAIAMRLILWKKLNRPESEWEPLARRIVERQNADGGWSQAKGMASDAWATGQALYALAQAGLKPTEPVIAQGRKFLISSQRDDGSWPMTSRPTKPGGKGSTSLIPITGAGSAWAILGLVQR